MKKEILTLIIGILIGAIITAAVFMIVKPNSKGGRPDFDGNFTQFGSFSKFDKDGGRPNMPAGERPSRQNGESRRKVEGNNTVKDDTKEE